MSLYFTLRVNLENSLGQVSITRTTNTSRSAFADMVSEYTVRLDGRRMGTVQHRYGDGAFVLASKALLLITARRKENDGSPPG